MLKWQLQLRKKMKQQEKSRMQVVSLAFNCLQQPISKLVVGLFAFDGAFTANS